MPHEMTSLPPPPSYESQVLSALVDPALALAAPGRGEPPDAPVRIVFANAAAMALTGFGLWQLVGHPIDDLQATPNPVLGTLAADLTHGVPGRVVLPIRRAAGGPLWVQASLSPLPTGVGEAPRGVCLMRAVTDPDRLLLRDPLTELATPTLLLDRIGLAIAGTGRQGGTVAVMACRLHQRRDPDDVDPAVADLVLRQTAARVRLALRPTDTAARLGGDELALVCPGLPDPSTGTQIAGRLLGVLQRPLSLPGGLLQPSASVGIAVLRLGVDTPDELLARARRALVTAEGVGGSCIRLE